LEGLTGLVDGSHSFDLLADDVVFEFIITVPDYPRLVAGRDNLIELYRDYQSTFFLDRCFDLRVHRADDSTVTLEYASEGKGHEDRTPIRQPVHLSAAAVCSAHLGCRSRSCSRGEVSGSSPAGPCRRSKRR
jgi:hypothetical protein